MKNKTVIILLSVLAVAMYTVAVINFCSGKVLSGIGEVLMASTDALVAYTVYRVGLMSKGLEAVYDAVAVLIIHFHEGCAYVNHCFLQKFVWCHNFEMFNW